LTQTQEADEAEHGGSVSELGSAQYPVQHDRVGEHAAPVARQRGASQKHALPLQATFAPFES
jgi:hypothetical protein